MQVTVGCIEAGPDSNAIEFVAKVKDAIKRAQKVGAQDLKMPDEATFGARIVQEAQLKLKGAKHKQRGRARNAVLAIFCKF